MSIQATEYQTRNYEAFKEKLAQSISVYTTVKTLNVYLTYKPLFGSARSAYSHCDRYEPGITSYSELEKQFREMLPLKRQFLMGASKQEIKAIFGLDVSGVELGRMNDDELMKVLEPILREIEKMGSTPHLIADIEAAKESIPTGSTLISQSIVVVIESPTNSDTLCTFTYSTDLPASKL